MTNAGTEERCPLCGSSCLPTMMVARSHVDEADHTIATCTACSFHFLSPRPDREFLGRIYQEHERKRPPMAEGARESPRWWTRLTGTEVAPRIVDADPVIDVGCGSGDQMLQLKRSGLRVEGFDTDREAVSIARRRGLDARVEDIDTVDLSDGEYSWIVMSHVLEHMLDPIPTLARLRSALKPGGRILIVVPDVNSPVRFLFGRWWHGWDPPFHLSHFSRSTLRKCLEAAGFTVDRIRSRGDVEDVTRSIDLKAAKNRRHLLLRVALIPIAWLGTLLGRGSYLVAVATSPGTSHNA